MKAALAIVKYLPSQLLIFSTLGVLGQTGEAYQVDTVSIYFNKNLDNFLASMKHDHFQTYDSKIAIPPFIGKQLDSLTGGFALANPKEDYQCCCTSDRALPKRKLEFLSMSKNVLVMTYLTGGAGVEEHILLIKFEDKRIIDMWYGVDLESLHSLKGVAGYLLKNRANPQDLHVNLGL